MRQRAAVATEVPPNFMTIQGALTGNGAFAFSLTGLFGWWGKRVPGYPANSPKCCAATGKRQTATHAGARLARDRYARRLARNPNATMETRLVIASLACRAQGALLQGNGAVAGALLQG
ncbi:hypothetical protein GCM10009552_25250 [Rothia nasimurium]